MAATRCEFGSSSRPKARWTYRCRSRLVRFSSKRRAFFDELLSIAYILLHRAMKHRMRDLDQLEEQDAEGRSSRTGVIVMAGAMAIGLGLAVFTVMSQAADSRSSSESDPLDQLDRV